MGERGSLWCDGGIIDVHRMHRLATKDFARMQAHDDGAYDRLLDVLAFSNCRRGCLLAIVIRVIPEMGRDSVVDRRCVVVGEVGCMRSRGRGARLGGCLEDRTVQCRRISEPIETR